MTLDKINKARELALKHGGKSGKIITALCDEIEHLTLKNQQLRRLTLRRGTHPVGVLEAWPYHPHMGKELHEIPEDYLIKWLEGRTRQGLRFDIHLGQIAERDLQLYNLISRLNTPIKPDAQQQVSEIKTETKPEPLPETVPATVGYITGNLSL